MRKSVFISLFISLFVHASYQPIYGMKRSALIVKSAPFLAQYAGKEERKMSSALRAALNRLENPVPSAGGLIFGEPLTPDEEGRISIYIYVDAIYPQVLDDLQEQGVKLGLYDEAQGLIQAFVLPEKVKDLEALSYVRRLDLPIRGYSRGRTLNR